MNKLINLCKESWFQKIIAIMLLVLVLIGVGSMVNLLLLTFIFSYIFYLTQQWIMKKTKNKLYLKEKWVTLSLYFIATTSIILVAIRYIPLLVKQGSILSEYFSSFSTSNFLTEIHPNLTPFVERLDIDQYLNGAGEMIVSSLAHASEFGLHIALAFLMSLFFNLERQQLIDFMKRMEKSQIGWLVLIYKEYGKSFVNSFGKVLQIQITISFVNAILSILLLWIIGFNQVIALGVMIFFLGLIPVAGVIISFIPLSIIAFQIGGIGKVVMLVCMIMLLHALESYLLNPKLMSVKTKLPVFFTFMTLIMSEHFLGVWGLLIGLPLLIFLLEIAKVPEIPDSSSTHTEER